MHQYLMIVMSLHIARCCIFSFCSTKMILLYALMISTFTHLLWNPFSPYLVLLMECLCFMTMFSYYKKLYIFAYAIRLLCMLSSYALYQGSVHNLCYIPPSDAFIYPLWFIWGLIILLCHSVQANHYIEENCIYPVTLCFNTYKLHVKGYLDSANFACYQGKCIIFLDQKYDIYAQNSDITTIHMHTMNADSIIECKKAQLYFGNKKEEVYVAFQPQLQLPNACPLLLNIRLLG